jgi:hypothetical protein
LRDGNCHENAENSDHDDQFDQGKSFGGIFHQSSLHLISVPARNGDLIWHHLRTFP